MKTIGQRLIKVCTVLLIMICGSCSSKDIPSASSQMPTDLTVTATPFGATLEQPDGDGSGTINVQVSAKNATSYQVIFPTEDNKTFTLNNPAGGRISYTFTRHPNTTTSYPVRVIAYNGARHIDDQNSVRVYQGDLKTDVTYWLTTPDRETLFQKQAIALEFHEPNDQDPRIDVDDKVQYQQVDGFGFTLTGGSAELIGRLEPIQKDALLSELFTTEGSSIGVSYLRLSIGASDLSSTAYSYDDTPGDIDLKDFSIAKERAYLLPLLKQITQLNPDIQIMATPWSAPAWMKSNNSFYGGGSNPGTLLPQYFESYANYFVKYIQAMGAEGITIHAVTPQNEPLNAYNNPSMLLTAEDENEFIKDYLAPAFRQSAIKTKIIIYDHNLDHPEYARSLLSDPETYELVDGTAFHLYAGDIHTMGNLHEAFKDKHLYFTEQYTSVTGDFGQDLQWHVKNLLIGAMRNWSRNVLEWNLAADPAQQPHLEGGCTDCLGAVTISDNQVTQRNQSYYIIAHAAKFVRPGSFRIRSTQAEELPNVAFSTPDAQHVLIVLNESACPRRFQIAFNGAVVRPTLPAGAVGTFVW